jgi:hypothetical protein
MLPDCESTWCWECERANISFPDLETAQMGFEVLDKDGNGDATRDEIEAAILGIHRERLSLEASMRDLDGAVRRLDDIFLGIVFVIALLILAAAIVSRPPLMSWEWADDRLPKSPHLSPLQGLSSSVSPGSLDLRCKRSYSLVSSFSSSTLTMLEIGSTSIPSRILLPKWLYCRPTLSVQMENSFGLDITS